MQYYLNMSIEDPILWQTVVQTILFMCSLVVYIYIYIYILNVIYMPCSCLPHTFCFQLLHQANFCRFTCFSYLLQPSSGSYNIIKTHTVDIVYQNRGPPLHQKQEISNTARSLETAFHVLKFCVWILHLYINLNNFSSTIHQLTIIKKLIYRCLTFADIR